jgi:hypothetical protein
MSARPFLPRPVAWRALLAGCALATGLSTLAGGGAMGEWIHKVMRGAAATVPVAPAEATVSAAPSRAAGAGPMAPPAHHAANAHPFAPGGDDLLPVGDVPPAMPPAPAPSSTPKLAEASAPRPAPPSALPPALSLLIWLDRPRVPVGDRAQLYLAATGATDCRGLGLLDGQALNNGRADLAPQPAGRHRVGVHCSGPGGTVERSLWLIVPWPVLASSQLNRSLVDFDLDRQPTLRQLGLADSQAEVQTAADFLQEGRHARWVLAATSDGGSIAFVLSHDDAGRWTDRSADLLDAGDRRGCNKPVQALTAVFNRDGRPDVFVACQGSALLFLSLPDGRYRRLDPGIALQASQAEALDVDGDGWTDVLATDASGATLWLRGRAPGVLDYGLK